MNDMIKKLLQIDQEILIEQIKHDFLSKKIKNVHFYVRFLLTQKNKNDIIDV